MAIRCLTLDKNDKDLIEECNYYIEQNNEFKKFILETKKRKNITDKDDDLLSIKISLSEYSYYNLTYFIFVLVQEGTISMDELEKLTNIIKENKESLYDESPKLKELINLVVESLEKDSSRKIMIEEFEERINELSKDYPESKPALEYIYKRAFFVYDTIIL